MPISLVDLYKKFAGTDAKALVSIHALAALNKHFGGNKYISQGALGEYLKNLTQQSLSQENDKIFMSLNEIGMLVMTNCWLMTCQNSLFLKKTHKLKNHQQ